MNPWLLALVALVLGAAFGVLGTIVFRRGRGGGGGEIVAPAPAQEIAEEAEAKAAEAREEAARAELEAKEADDASPADWINEWARARSRPGDDDPDPSRGD